MNKEIILSAAYFPPIQYMTKFFSCDRVIIEAHENYIKQTYRNRCNILTANGVQALIVPVKKTVGNLKSIKDIEIDYKNNWPEMHLKTLFMAYKSSPFYEYYINAFENIIKNREKYLFDLNSELLDSLLTEIEIDKRYSFSESYIHEYPNDYRNTINPKEKNITEDKDFEQKKYTQVFSDKLNFTENLSILDLLFNEGPITEIFLKSCIKKH